VTVQSTAAFDRIVPLRREAIVRSLFCAAKSYRFRAVKIGMVGTRAAAEAILSFLSRRSRLPVVLDPVLRASSGGALLARDALPPYRELLRRSSVITPNLPEIEKILNRKVGTFGEAMISARDLSYETGAAVVLKGGHFPWKGRKGIDIVFERSRVTLLAPGGKVRQVDAHGTGCAFASALAARLALGDPVAEAARSAKALLERWIAGGFLSAEGRWTLFP